MTAHGPVMKCDDKRSIDHAAEWSGAVLHYKGMNQHKFFGGRLVKSEVFQKNSAMNRAANGTCATSRAVSVMNPKL